MINDVHLSYNDGGRGFDQDFIKDGETVFLARDLQKIKCKDKGIFNLAKIFYIVVPLFFFTAGTGIWALGAFEAHKSISIMSFAVCLTLFIASFKLFPKNRFRITLFFSDGKTHNIEFKEPLNYNRAAYVLANLATTKKYD